MIMKIINNIEVTTGNILIVEGDKGRLECLSLGDYGKDVNIKASFMGINRNIEQVKHQEMLPLSKKWVVTISTQYGCSMMCTFCDVPNVGRGRNCTYGDLLGQVISSISLHPEVDSTERLNIHFARMGEPTWNPEVLKFAYDIPALLSEPIGGSTIHPVVSTMMPRTNKRLESFISEWVYIKNIAYGGDAGLQLSINSTSDIERENMFSGNSLSLSQISSLMSGLPIPVGRKYTLNFALADYTIDAKQLANLFDRDKFLVKITPMHKTHAALKNSITTSGDYTTHYPYDRVEEELKSVGFDVLVFIASEEEDLGRITCGNAILSGSTPKEFNYKEQA
jgi:23S rRNA (adenine2503-C2)-methyltransferase